MLLKVAEMNNKLVIFWKSRHFILKIFRQQRFVSVYISIGTSKISDKIGRSFHKFSRKSGGKRKKLF